MVPFLSRTSFGLLCKPLLIPWEECATFVTFEEHIATHVTISGTRLFHMLDFMLLNTHTIRRGEYIEYLMSYRVYRTNKIVCAKGRDYSSSLPVRYVRKKITEIENPVYPSVTRKLPEDFIVKKHKRFEQKVEVSELYEGREEQCKNLNEQEAVSSLNTCVGSGEGEIAIGFWAEDNYTEEPSELSDEHKSNLLDLSNGKYQTQACGNRQDAERIAIQLLSTRAFTASELRKKLQGKNFPLDTVDMVVADFQNRGYINDGLYAETFSRSRWSSSCWGPKRIKQALFGKGVSKPDAEEAIKLVFQEDESVEGQELVAGMSKLSMDHLLLQASKQWLRNKKVSSEKQKSRLIQWLQYRGFNWSVISFVLKKLESGYVP